MVDILRTPYEEPLSHLQLDQKGRTTDVEAPGRRLSTTASGLPGIAGEADPEAVEPHKTINRLRLAVKEWREAGYPGTTSATRRLLDFWLGIDAGVSGMRPFWCQMEAIETIVWLFEAGQSHDPKLHKRVAGKLEADNKRHNGGMPRAAFKMATGTGKTNVMIMMMLWILANREMRSGAVDFLVVAPNRPVKDRLSVLKPDVKKIPWNSLTPRAFYQHVARAQVTVVNFQAFQRRNATFDGKTPGKKEWAMLGQSAMENFMESDMDMVRRVLRGHSDDARFIVINDEAHHCYRPEDVKQADGEAEEERQNAALWFSALKALDEQDKLEQVYDFSATPMWLSVPRGLNSELFPWTVSDYPLQDAIESGLVKIPRLPVEDDTESHVPMYRNVYRHNDGKDLVGRLSMLVQEPLKQLYRHYEKTVSPKYEDACIIPVFIVVANNIRNAAALYRWIAGSWDKRDGRGVRGDLGMLSNYGTDGRPVEHPPTMLVHSKPTDKTMLTGKYKDMVEEQSMLFGLKGSLADKDQQIREMLASIGSGDARHIRCVVSVSMLTEGWDAKNVTHIFGYRKFDSLLLCEQVTGRALRRTSLNGDGMQEPEYANIFGVPYTFARGGEVDPRPPVQPYEVFSVPEREALRIEFPNVVDYRNREVRRRFRLDHDKVGPYIVDPGEPTVTVAGGAGGRELRTRRVRRRQTAVWHTALVVSSLLHADSGEDYDERVITGRGSAFADSVGIVEEWLAHPNVSCPDVAGLAADQHAPRLIAEACTHDDREVGPQPVFADERMEGERVLATEDVMFQTTLRCVYPEAPQDGEQPFLKKSELNRAACHTYSEVGIARILDTHPLIEAWARNFRLDFRIPWLDGGARRYTEPDFVARVKTKDGSKLHLVIEFKGEMKGEADEEAKRHYTANIWCPAVSGCGEYGEWRSVWIEDAESAYVQISEACS